MMPPSRFDPAKPPRGAWLRGLVIVGLVVVVVLASALQWMGAPSWFSLGGTSSPGATAPVAEWPGAGEQGESGQAAAKRKGGKKDKKKGGKKGKRHGGKKGKKKGGRQGKQKRNKKSKRKSNVRDNDRVPTAEPTGVPGPNIAPTPPSIPPTATPEPTATSTPTPTATPEPTATPTPSPTPTPIPPTPTPDPNVDAVVMAAGDNVCGEDSTGGSCRQMATSNLLVAENPDAVLVLGDVQYECGEASDFTSFYDPSWGRVKAISRPAVGNHEYRTSTDPTHACFGNPPNAQAYFDYFGAAAGEIGKGYYSFDLGNWHLIALNSNCSFVGGCSAGSPQERWLRADLAASTKPCTLAYWHTPLYSSGGRATTVTRALYQALYDFNAEVVLTGHDHTYERFAPQDAQGNRDDARGIRQFVVGTGGRNMTSWATIAPNSEVRQNSVFGVLELTLHPYSYEWQFVPIAGQSFSDGGSTACH